MTSVNEPQLISHNNNQGDLNIAMAELSAQIEQQGELETSSVAQRLDYLQQLSQFDFGRFLIINRGINGYWTHYMLTYPWHGMRTGLNNAGEPISDMEHFLLNAPIMRATQQRFEIFLAHNQTAVRNGASLGCCPSGLLGELLYLNFDGITDIELVGMDFDANTLHDAQQLAQQRGLEKFVELIETNAWQLQQHNRFDLLSSNGLNIYEPDDSKVTELYRQFYKALKPGGKLVTSFVTPPPQLSDNCEWQLDQLDPADLIKQKTIFADTLHAKWQCFRSSETTRMQLHAAGFENMEFYPDDTHLFPTVVAIKPS